jgi:hypothetical protein
MDNQEKQISKMSLFKNGLIIYALIVFSFAFIYTIYTFQIGNDYGLKRDTFLDTLVNSLLLSSFTTSGSIPPNIDHNSSFARLIIIFNVFIASISKIWLVTVEN